MKNKYIEQLVDIEFLKDYRYVSREEFLTFISIHIRKILNQIEISTYICSEEDKQNEIENVISKALDDSIKLYSSVTEGEIKKEDIDNVIYELAKRKVFEKSINNLIVLEEIEYLGRDISEKKLRNIYYYLLELEIYEFFSVKNLKWKSINQKNYIFNKVKNNEIQNKIKKELIESGTLLKENEYLYNKTIGFISTYPIEKIINKYDEYIMLDIYRIKYLLSLTNELQKYSDNKKLITENELIVKDHKEFFKNIIDNNKVLINDKDTLIHKLREENEIKQNTIIKYANCINEYNELSWIKKIAKIIKNDEIKLLN